MADEHTADFQRFKRDHGYTGNLTSGNIENKYKKGKESVREILSNMRSSDPRVKIDADTAVGRITELYDSQKISLNTARQAISEILPNGSSNLVHKPRTLRELNTAMQLGVIGKDEGAHAATDLISENHPANKLLHDKVIPERLKLSQKTWAGRLGHQSYTIAKFSGKTAGKTTKTGGKLAARAGSRLITNSMDSQMGGSGNPVLDDVSDSAQRTGKKVAGTAGRGALTVGGAALSNVGAYRKMRKVTITNKDKEKVKEVLDEKGKPTKAAKSYAKKLKSEDVHHAEKMPNAIKTVAGGTAKDVGKAAGTATRKSLSSTPASAAKFTNRQVSKLTSDMMGASDPTLSSMGRVAGKAAAPLTHPIRTAKRARRTVKTTQKVVTTVAKAAVRVVQATAQAVVHAVTFLVSNPAGWAVLGIGFAVALIIVFFGSCTSVSMPFVDAIASALSSYQVSRNIAWIAEEEYKSAESGLYSSSQTKLTVAEVVEEVDPDNTYGLNNTNAYITYETDTVYHNPYNWISYLEAKYEGDWDLDDVYYEIDYGIFQEQYDTEVGIDMDQNEGDLSVTNRWVLTSKLTNNGFDATARRLLSEMDETGGLLQHYLTLNYYYGMTEYDENEYNDDGTISRSGFWWDPDYIGVMNGYWWDVETYKTHDENVTLDEFLDGVTGGFDVDLAPNASAVANGSYEQMGTGSSYVDPEAGFMWPLENFYSISSGFGMRVNPVTYVWKMHNGIDIGTGGTNPPILCSMDGVVVTNAADLNTSTGRGYYIFVDHPGTPYRTVYQHMVSQSPLPVGTTVKQGDVVGYVGRTGAATGEHLHFEIWVNGTPVNPMNYFPNMS